MTRFFIVRHGETEWNKVRRIQGVSDIPLNDTGLQQAHAVAEILSAHSFDAIVSSPLSRARDTARVIAERLGMPEPEIFQGLIERNYGDAEGSNGQDLDHLYPPGTEIPGREPREAVTARALAVLRELALRHPDSDVIAVAHGGVIRSVVEHVAPGQHNEPITNCSVHSFRMVAGSLELVAFDDPMEVAAHDLAAVEFEDQNPAGAREDSPRH
ncbi:MAG: histidine phosphatase family protein [Pontimonas sp.]|nr:histidine phosphatase family protein [Pontimonas sp.]